jgi:heme-degrading monooxygenase HmoA
MFLWTTFQSQRQVVRSAGFRGGKLLVDARHTYWTLTTWDDEKAMKQFRGSGAHARVMKKLPHWCDEAAYTHWVLSGESLPNWPEVHERLVADGRLSRVDHPSVDHLARRFPTPRLKPLIGQNLNPVQAVNLPPSA